MPPVGYEPTIAVRKRQQNYALGCTATGTSNIRHNYTQKLGVHGKKSHQWQRQCHLKLLNLPAVILVNELERV
jgi:hypothetical protein